METLLKTKNLYKIIVPTPFGVGPVNVYLLKGEQLILVDTGPNTKEAWEALQEGLKEVGYSTKDIDMIVLTHHHSDHSGLLNHFENVPVYGHWRNEPWISHDAVFFRAQEQFLKKLFVEEGIDRQLRTKLLQERGPDRYLCKAHLSGKLQEGDRVPGFDDWQVIETPGHAYSHISFYREKDGVLLAGDNLITHLSPTPLLEPPYPGETDRPKTLLQYRSSLKKYADMDISIAYSGHGEDVFDTPGLITKQMEKQERRAEKVRNQLKEGEKTAFQISMSLFPNAYNRETYLTMSETIGILDVLESYGEVHSVMDGNVKKYRLNK